MINFWILLVISIAFTLWLWAGGHPPTLIGALVDAGLIAVTIYTGIKAFVPGALG